LLVKKEKEAAIVEAAVVEAAVLPYGKAVAVPPYLQKGSLTGLIYDQDMHSC
jgi:hypothetical protein